MRNGSPLTERYINPVYDAIRAKVGYHAYAGGATLSRGDVAFIFDIIAKAQNEYTPGELCMAIALSQVLGELDIPDSEPNLPVQLDKVTSYYWYDATKFVPPDHMKVVSMSPEGDVWFDSYISSFGWGSPITPKEFHWLPLSNPYSV